MLILVALWLRGLALAILADIFPHRSYGLNAQPFPASPDIFALRSLIPPDTEHTRDTALRVFYSLFLYVYGYFDTS